jgi:Chlorophyll A-B binding protein
MSRHTCRRCWLRPRSVLDHTYSSTCFAQLLELLLTTTIAKQTTDSCTAAAALSLRNVSTAGFSNNPPRPWLIGGEGRSLKWYREAELTHGRVAMLAALGWVVPEFVHFPGNAQVGVDAFAKTNPWDALYSVPDAGLWQIAAAISAVEVFRIGRVIRGDREAGDLGLGQGEGRWNPFGLNYSEEEYEIKRLQEVKNGRLAMVAIIGLFLQSAITNEGIIEQLSGAFTFPAVRS